VNQHTVRIKVAEIDIECTLNRTITSLALLELLPITASTSTWGNEIYFPIGLGAEIEPASSDVVESGAIAYWPPGDAFCIFYGKTPASTPDEIRAASPVTLLGTVNGDETVFKSIRSGEEITIYRR